MDLSPNQSPDGNAHHGASQSYRALVVEDHADTRLMLKTILEMQNFGVLEATDGKMGLRMAIEELPDIILMDSVLPLADGLTVTRAIRSQKKIGHVPIIFISGHAAPAWRQAAFDAGCDEYLVKPFSLDEMLKLMKRLLLEVKMPSAENGRD